MFFAAVLPRAAAGGPHSVTLLWTAPGDDADTGRASRYDLRYSTSAVGADTASWWNGATQVSGLPWPSSAGGPDSVLASGLASQTTYSFVIRTFDDAGNGSPFSNVAVATTDPAPPGCDAPATWPSQFTAVNDEGAVLLSWAPTTDSLAVELHIWRGTGTGPMGFLATAPLAETSYRDTSAQSGRTYTYRATWASACDDGPASNPRTVTVPGSPANAAASSAAPEVALHAYPNPAEGNQVHFVIHVGDPAGDQVQIRLFDLSGRVIADIADGSYPSGDTVISWPRLSRNGDRVAPGYYETIGTIGMAPVRERIILLP